MTVCLAEEFESSENCPDSETSFYVFFLGRLSDRQKACQMARSVFWAKSLAYTWWKMDFCTSGRTGTWRKIARSDR